MNKRNQSLFAGGASSRFTSFRGINLFEVVPYYSKPISLCDGNLDDAAAAIND